MPTMSTDERVFFYGHDEKESCDRFVSRVMDHAFANGKIRDYQWMADFAATGLRGEAMNWWMGLDKDVQFDWRRLRVALAERYSLRIEARPLSVSVIPTAAAAPPHRPASSSQALGTPSVLSVPDKTLQPAGRFPVTEWSRDPGTMQLLSLLPNDEDAWLHEARQRRAAYDKVRPDRLPSVYWVMVEKGNKLPAAAIHTGLGTNGEPLYCARAWLNGGLHPGKCGNHISGARITYSDEEKYDIAPFEVLVGNASAVCWMANPMTPAPVGKTRPTQMKPFQGIEGGFRKDRLVYLLALCYTEGQGWQPGKLGISWEKGMNGWDRKVFHHKQCRILTWA